MKIICLKGNVLISLNIYGDNCSLDLFIHLYICLSTFNKISYFLMSLSLCVCVCVCVCVCRLLL